MSSDVNTNNRLGECGGRMNIMIVYVGGALPKNEFCRRIKKEEENDFSKISNFSDLFERQIALKKFLCFIHFCGEFLWASHLWFLISLRV